MPSTHSDGTGLDFITFPNCGTLVSHPQPRYTGPPYDETNTTNTYDTS